jgi:hypothetical protein
VQHERYVIILQALKKRKIGTALSWKKTQSSFIVDCCESSYLPRLRHSITFSCLK